MAADTYARFYVHPQPQGEDTIKSGGPRFKDVVYAEIFVKGSKNTSSSRPIKEQDKTDYPKAWQAFKENSFEMTDGTPISVLPGIGPSQKIELQSQGILSVEELAELNDSVVVGVSGMVTLRNRAKAYLAASAVLDEPEVDSDPVDIEELNSSPDVIPAEGNQGVTAILSDTAPNIIDVLGDLSTGELQRIRDAEMSGKQRKGLIKAINQRLAM